jgi:hypothetical protein
MTLTLEQARELAEQAMVAAFPNKDVVLQPEKTEVKPFGWVFYYNSRDYVESGDFLASIPGNGPILVDNEEGTVQLLSSSPGLVAEQLKEYARRRGYSDDRP